MTTATMNTVAQPAARINDFSRIWRLTKLHLADRMTMIVTPLILIPGVVVVVSAIYLIVAHFTSVEPTALTAGFRQGNQAVLWMFPGYAISMGVLAYARTMPFAIGMMGSTRRQFWLGTMLWIVLQAAYVTALAVVFLGLERVTGDWFVGAPVFGVGAMGNGNPGILAMMVFTLLLMSLSIGTALSAIYLRWNTLGVWVGIAGIVVVLLALVVVILATGTNLLAFFSTHTHAKFAGVMALLAVIAAAVCWVVLRRVPVNR